jgi:hypothetical protein
MKVNSRMVTTLTSFLSVPVYYDDIEISTSPGVSDALGYSVRSGGLRAEAMITGNGEETESQDTVPPEFITERLLGFAGAGNGMYRFDVEQPGMDPVSARVQNVKAPSLERLGLLTEDQSTQPNSALYVRDGMFGADTPVREW